MTGAAPVPGPGEGREHTLTTRDGVALSARYDPPLRPGAAELGFVVVHGFTGSWRRPGVRAAVDVLRRYGSVVSFDLRGHGASCGRASVGATEHEDVAAAVAAARRLGCARVVTVGFSLGAAVSIRSAGLDGGVDAVVAISGPSRWNYRGTPPMRRLHAGIGTRAGRLVLERVYATRVTPRGWDPAPLPPDALAARVAPAPLLVVHGDQDLYFPLDHALWLVEAGGPTATLWLERGMGHAEAGAGAGLLTRVAEWAVAVVSEPDPSARMRA
jgi:pimeloyl-ACP methyl ester carboxylesterase